MVLRPAIRTAICDVSLLSYLLWNRRADLVLDVRTHTPLSPKLTHGRILNVCVFWS
jgi:hypothetical protein